MRDALTLLLECNEGPNKGKPGPCPDPSKQSGGGGDKSASQPSKVGKIGTVVSAQHLAAVQTKAQAKARANPKPTAEEVAAAKEGLGRLGANKYRRNLVGNTGDRARRRQSLLTEFGDGKTCPCIYCGEVVGEGTMEQDKIKTTAEGGRYRTPNLVPSCSVCNKKRGDTPWEKIKWEQKS